MVIRNFFQKNSQRLAVERGLTENYDSLWRYCFSLSKNRADAEDLLQSACHKALRNAGQLREEGAVKSWLFRICYTNWLSTKRYQNVRQVEPIDEQAELKATTGTADACIQSVYLNQVLAQIEALPEKQSSIFTLVVLNDLSYQEASEVLNIPIGTVMSRLNAARSAIRDLETSGGNAEPMRKQPS